MNKNFIKRLSQNAFGKKQDVIGAEPGTLGDLFGNLLVPNRVNYVYVRLQGNRIVECFNNRVPPTMDLPVLIGFDPLMPNLYQVLSSRTGAVGAGNIPSGNTYIVAPHHSTHEWLGSDIVFVSLRQYLPLRVAPAGGLSVSVHSGFYTLGTETGYLPTGVLDLTSYVPYYDEYGNQQAKFVLIVIRADEFYVIDSTPSPIDGLVLITSFPERLASDIPLAAVRLWTEQLAIIETTLDTDVNDLRTAYLGYGDMTKAIYDIDDDGIVDAAELAGDIYIGALGAVTDPSAGDDLVLERGGIRYKFDLANLVTTTDQQYRQFVYIVSGGDFSFVIDSDGNPVMTLLDLE